MLRSIAQGCGDDGTRYAADMPFTLAHPAAVLPVWWLVRKRLPLTGLAIGAMVPDVRYFLALRPVGTFGHTALGVLLQGVPAGLLIAAVWLVVCGPLKRTLPSVVSARLPPRPSMRRPGEIAAMALAVAIGGFTHLLWDGFTHQTGFAVTRWSVLEAPIGPLPLYSLLQHSGGVLGLLLLGGLGGRALVRRTPTDTPPPLSARGRVLSWLAMVLGSVAMSAWAMRGGGSMEAVVVRGVIGLVSGGIVAAVALGLLLRLTATPHSID